MKRIEGFKSFEAVGVPSGLVEISGKVYEILVKKLKDGFYSIDEEQADPDVYKYPTRHIYIQTNVSAKDLGDVKAINDYDIKEFDIMVNLDIVDYPKDMKEDSPAERMAGAGYGPKNSIDRKNFKTVYEDNGEIDIRISLRFFEPKEDVQENQYWERMVIETFEYNKSGIISNLGHEIMHAYDLGHVKGGEGHYSSSRYAAYSNMRFGIKAIDNFFFYMYYTTRCESIVRNAEVATAMDAQGIEQSKFAEYLSSNQTYKMLKEVQAWTYEGMVEEMKADLRSEKSEIRKVVGSATDISKISDDELIDKLLAMAVHRMNTESIDSLLDRIKVPMFFGVPMIDPEDDATDEEKQEYYNAFVKVARKDVQDPVKYYKNKEKFFQETAGKLIKKLGKLFSLAKPSDSNPLHAKISSKTKKNESRITKWNDFGH
jgi:hypothetical protein